MIGRGGAIGALLLLILSAVFARLNAGRFVRVDFGLFEVARVPVAVVVFGALLVGMAIMLLTGLRSDLRVREILRKKWEEDGRREKEWRDRNQQDLFGPQGADATPGRDSDTENDTENGTEPGAEPDAETDAGA